MIDKVIYLRLKKANCYLIKADPDYFQSIIPTLRQFWNYVIFYRKHPKELDKLEKYIKDVGVDSTAEIFLRIHSDFVKIYPDTKTKPLHQEENPWRTQFKAKKEKNLKFQKYLEYKKPTKKT